MGSRAGWEKLKRLYDDRTYCRQEGVPWVGSWVVECFDNRNLLRRIATQIVRDGRTTVDMDYRYEHGYEIEVVGPHHCDTCTPPPRREGEGE